MSTGVASGTNPITFESGQNVIVATTASVVRVSAGGIENRIINGAMAVDVRNAGAAQTITAGAALAYTVDRFYAYCTGANVTGQRVAGSGQAQYRYQFTGAASVTAIGFGTRLEAINTYDINNSTCTLSVDLANSLLTSVTWTAYYANSADTFGTLASPTRTQIATGTFTVNSTVTRYSTTISIPSAATTGVEVVLSVGAQTSGTWTIGNVQLIPGSDNIPYLPISIAQTKRDCRRYLPWICGNTSERFSAFPSNTTTSFCLLPFLADARSQPSGIVVSSASHFTVHNYTNGSSGAATAITFALGGIINGGINVTTTAGSPTLATGNLSILYPNSASALLYFTGSEL